MAPESDAIWTRISQLCIHLRSAEGCAWDRAQTPDTLLPYLLEEVHEVAEALAVGSAAELTEEIGDALYLWIFFMQVLESAGRVRLDEAADSVVAKLIRRHPHIFDPEALQGAAPPPRAAWEQRKRLEAPEGSEFLRPLPAGLPALLRARRIQEKAAAFGFDWTDAREVLPKVREEVDELDLAIRKGLDLEAVREELGDLLFAVVNLSRHLGQDPEAALLTATEKFRGRFNRMAQAIEASGRRMGDVPLDDLEAAWQEEKRRSSSGNLPEDR